MERTRDTLLDDTAKDMLKRFVDRLNPAMSMAPHAYDEGRWREFVGYVFQRAEPKDARELVATAGPVRALLGQYGLGEEAVAHWAFRYEAYMRGWASFVR
jgi:hypothetical protein